MGAVAPGICLWVVLLFLAGSLAAAGGAVLEGVVYVDGTQAVGTTDDTYVCATLDWWPPEKCDYGTCSWGLASMLNLNLSSPILLNVIKAFSPLKIRLGGTLQDNVIYDVGDPKPASCPPFVKDTSNPFGFSGGCLPMPRWDALNDLFRNSGAEVIFGLNALNGRTRQRDGSMTGPWDSTNAAALIRYTVEKGYTIRGWELGNELSGSGVGVRVYVSRYAADTINLKHLVDTIYGGAPGLPKPLVIAPGGFFDATWFQELVNRTKPGFLDAISHHIYNLGPGVDTHLVDKILNPSYLDGEASTFSRLQGILRNAGTNTKAWVGEAGGAYNSGRNHVTNTYVFSFWYLDQLGMAASYDTKTYCRQTLVGGNYGLLNTTTYKPNPDYYSALLWHRLMGTQALSTNFAASKYLRAYAHCARQSDGITLLLINLDGNTTTTVTPTPTKSTLLRRHAHHHPKSRRMPFYHADSAGDGVREEYHLTPQGGDLQSQTVLLNGNPLDVDDQGHVPPLGPVVKPATEPIVVDPHSIVFVHIPQFDAPACR